MKYQWRCAWQEINYVSPNWKGNPDKKGFIYSIKSDKISCRDKDIGVGVKPKE